MTRFLALFLILPVTLFAEPPKRSVFTYELLEVDRADWLQWTSDPKNSILGPELRAHLHQLQETGKATVSELAMCASRLDVRSKAESLDEIMYPDRPQDWTPTSAPAAGKEGAQTPQLYPSAAGQVGDELIVFDLYTRNIGTTLEIDIGSSPEHVTSHALNFSAGPVWISRMLRRGEGLIATDIPEIGAQLTSTSLDLKPGEPRLIGATRPPRSVNGSRQDPISLAFCRLDIVQLPDPPPTEVPDPKAKDEADPFRNLEVPEAITGTLLVEWVEVRHEDLKRLVDAAPDQQRAKVRELEKLSQAKLLETSIISTRGPRAKSNSIREFVYASEYDPTEMTLPDGKMVYPRVPAAFETRNLGYDAEIELDWGQPGLARLNLSVSHTELNGMRAWGDPLANLEMPDIHTVSASLAVELPWGESRLITTGKAGTVPAPGFPDSRVMVFARMDGAPKPAPEKPVAKPKSASLQYVVQAIETTQTQLSGLLVKNAAPLSGPELWTALAADGAVAETLVISGTPGTRIRGYSADELMYPSNFDPAYIGPKNQILPPFPGGYETRNTGTDLELDASRQEDLVSLNLSVSEVSLNGIRPHFDPSLRVATPEFHTQRLSQAVDVTLSGGPAFLGTTRPRAKEDAWDDTIRAWFIRIREL